jgi:hypothetical protein
MVGQRAESRRKGVANRYELTVNVHSDDRTYTTKHGTKATINTSAIGKSALKEVGKKEHFGGMTLSPARWREHRIGP